MKKMAEAFKASMVSQSAMREEYGLSISSRVLEVWKLKDDKPADIINQLRL